ncbi:MotE family protein [Pseudaestuariivita rosea]|uniref:MotE family protein n=1 Tax=Pseudaestuariivita rosea TaxID=2763263 RepID=UPI001ABB7BF6|nr:hypothetical protein [Pseudaestuariivita rosea]
MARKQKKTRRGKGTLFLIAGLLAASGIFRLSGGVGEAVAREFESFSEAEVIAETQTCSADLEPVLAAIQARESRLEEREAQLEKRMQELAHAEVAIRENYDALVTAEEELAATLARVESAAEDDVSRLTAVYENMKPKDAAALFEEMAPEFAAGFLARMRPDAAAEVMAGLQPKTAYTISVLLAGRNADLPKE